MGRLSGVLTPRRVLWLALATVLAASWSHVAGTFGTLEAGGPPDFLLSLAWLMGPLAAVAIDLGLIGLAWGVGARKRAEPDKTPVDLWVGIGIFALLSALANFDHALTVLGQGPPLAPGVSLGGAVTWAGLDGYARVKVMALSATLPLLAVYLTRVVETAVDGRPRDTAGQDADHVPVDLTQPGQFTAWQWDYIERDTPLPVNGQPVAGDKSPEDAQANAGETEGQDRGKLTAERYRDIAAEHVQDGTGAQESDRIVASVAGVSPKTAQRARLKG